MKANEFVKRFGVDDAREYLCGASFWEIDGKPIAPCVNNLKRLIESYELINSMGGISFVKDNLPLGYFGNGNYKELIQECLEDVESCL